MTETGRKGYPGVGMIHQQLRAGQNQEIGRINLAKTTKPWDQLSLHAPFNQIYPQFACLEYILRFICIEPHWCIQSQMSRTHSASYCSTEGATCVIRRQSHVNLCLDIFLEKSFKLKLHELSLPFFPHKDTVNEKDISNLWLDIYAPISPAL